jgi:gas vesicle protein GvpL/GvpF
VIHLYAFAPGGVRLPEVAGIGGARIEAHAVVDVAAVASTVVEGDAARSRDAILAHGLVVEALREAADAVLPVRFGERFRDRDELVGVVGDRVAPLRESLARVRGCAEFGVRMLGGGDGTEPAPAADGTSYLRLRLAARARTEAVAGELHEPLARWARASVVTSGGEHAFAYLVGDAERAPFEAALAAFVDAHPDVTVVCTGPWAPYSFVEGS